MDAANDVPEEWRVGDAFPVPLACLVLVGTPAEPVEVCLQHLTVPGDPLSAYDAPFELTSRPRFEELAHNHAEPRARRFSISYHRDRIGTGGSMTSLDSSKGNRLCQALPWHEHEIHARPHLLRKQEGKLHG